MHLPSFEELFSRLRLSDESVQLEAKTATEVGKSILETVSAFSNEPNGGGYILLGVAPSSDGSIGEYEVCGVTDSDKIQKDFATQCRNSFNITIRPIINVEEFNEKTVITAYIPEAAPHEKPVFIKSRGISEGAFRRIGPTDQHCTEEDIELFFQLRESKTFDSQVIQGSSLADIDPDALDEYRNLRGKINSTAAELDFSDEELLSTLGGTSKTHDTVQLTYCGLLCFGKETALRTLLPSVRVDYIRVCGTDWVTNPEDRFDAIEMRGPLLTLIPRVIDLSLGDLPKTFSIRNNEHFREEIPAIPTTVIREAIVNCLMHRNYRMAQPVQIIRYANRVEIKNAGRSLIPDDRLGEPGSLARNEKIAAILHEVGFAETKGSGIRAMQKLMQIAGSVPFFESDRVKDTFTVTLLTHHLLSKEDFEWLKHFKNFKLEEDELKAIVVMREMGALTNADYRSLNGVDILTANTKLRKLRDYGLFEQKGRGSQIYFKPTNKLLNPEPVKIEQPINRDYDFSLSILKEDLPLDLKELVDGVDKQSTYVQVSSVIRHLCGWRPLNVFEIASILDKEKLELQRDFLRLMLQKDELELEGEAPNEPKYVLKATATDSNR